MSPAFAAGLSVRVFCVALLTVALLAPAAVGAQTGSAPAAEQGQPVVYPQPTQLAPRDPRDYFDASVDLGVGLLEFIHLDIAWLISREWSIGVGAGFFPIDWLLRRAMGVEDLYVAAQLQDIELTGDLETKLGSGRIFGRWFPWAKTFLTEVTIEVWRMMITATGTLTDVDDQLVDISTTAKVWVPMIGVHAGWRIMWKNGAYLDLVGGLNVLLSPGAEVTFGGDTIEEVSENPEVAAALESAQDFLSEELQKGANKITKDLKAFPTAAIRFGWAFDLW